MPVAAVLLLLAGALAAAPGLRAQASAQLQPLDAVHRELERLGAWGLIDTMLVGQRPYSRAQAARLTAQALRGRARLVPDSPADASLAATADRALARLRARLAPELEALGVAHTEDAALPAGGLVGEARLDATWTDSPDRVVPSNVLGSTAARINPMLAYDLGRPVGTGTTVGAEIELGGALGSHLAGAVRTRAQLSLPLEGGSETTVRVQSGNARLVVGNAALTVGRAHVVWGQGPRGGLVLSANPGSHLLVSIANEHPVGFPLLGPARFQLFLSDMGVEAQRFAHSQLFGARASFLPHRRLEIGAQFLVQSGGEGAPEQSVVERILDYLFFPDLLKGAELELLLSNKVAAVDARLRIPEARGLELWIELAIDDIDIDRFQSMIWEDGSWTVGARVARVDAAGTLALRLEAQHTSLRIYEHVDFTSGLTLERRLIGSELGPNANGAAVGLDWEATPRHSFSFEGSIERRSADPYTAISGTPYYFARLGIRPKEVRWRARVGWTLLPERASWCELSLEGGYEFVDHFEFSRRGTQHNLLARTVIVARLP